MSAPSVLDDEQTLVRLVTVITTRGTGTLDVALLAQIKQLCRRADVLVDAAAIVVFAQFRKNHAQIRFSALQLADVLFSRSRIFRAAVVDRLPEFFELTLGLRRALPPPKSWATRLKNLALAVLREWSERFGSVIPQLALGITHLRNDYSVSLDLNTSAVLTDTQRMARVARINQQRREKFLDAIREFDEMEGELIEQELKMASCFDILVPVFDHVTSGAQNAAGSSSRAPHLEHGLASRSYRLVIELNGAEAAAGAEETPENTVVFDELRGCYRLIKRRYFDKLKQLGDTLTRVDDQDLATQQRAYLQKIITHRQKMRDAVRKCDDLRIFENQIEEEGDDSDEFEQVPVGDAFAEVAVAPRIVRSPSPPPRPSEPGSPSKGKEGADDHLNVLQEDENEEVHVASDPEQEQEEMDEERKALLDLAPTVDWGEDLENWELTTKTFNSTGLERMHRFYGAGTEERPVSEKTIEDMKKRVVYYPVELPQDIEPCKAPLKNGKLCTRRDLIKCPFHGPKIARDERGTPIDPAQRAQQLEQQASSPAKPAAWELIEEDVRRAAGLPDLTAARRRRGRRSEDGGPSRLVDVKKEQDTAKTRILKKLDDPRSAKRIRESMDDVGEHKRRDRDLNRW